VQDAAHLEKRSGNWRNVFDASVGFARPRLADGTWTSPYDPVQLGHSSKWRDYTESNGWQATFLNQHDVPGLIAAMGGDTAFEAKLDALFAAPSTLPKGAPPDISGMLGQYAHGNEPSHHVAYLYAWCGAHWKTQRMVRRLLTTMYTDKPDGIIGNDDCGQMSAWFILRAGFLSGRSGQRGLCAGQPAVRHRARAGGPGPRTGDRGARPGAGPALLRQSGMERPAAHARVAAP
jgi:predicted alpha-1,2-mannosidase